MTGPADTPGDSRAEEGSGTDDGPASGRPAGRESTRGEQPDEPSAEAAAVGAPDPLLPVGTARRSTWWRTLAALVLFGAVVSLPLWVGGTVADALVDVAVLVAIAQWWGWLAGFVGRPVLCAALFAGTGTMMWAGLVDHLSVNPVVALAGAALASGVVGLLVGMLAARLDAAWTAAVSLALTVAAGDLAGALSSEKNDVAGVTALGAALRRSLATWLAVVVGAGSVAAVVALRRSRPGLALVAARDDRDGAARLGVRIGSTTAWVTAAAAAAIGAAGAISHLQSGTIEPPAVFATLVWTWPAVVAAVLGGLRTQVGPVVGAVLVVALQRALAGHPSAFLVVTAVVVLGVLTGAPLGVVGTVEARLGAAGQDRIAAWRRRARQGVGLR